MRFPVCGQPVFESSVSAALIRPCSSWMRRGGRIIHTVARVMSATPARDATSTIARRPTAKLGWKRWRASRTWLSHIAVQQMLEDFPETFGIGPGGHRGTALAPARPGSAADAVEARSGQGTPHVRCSGKTRTVARLKFVLGHLGYEIACALTDGPSVRPTADRDGRVPVSASSRGLADVIEIVLDKGIVIDAYVRVSRSASSSSPLMHASSSPGRHPSGSPRRQQAQP